MTPPARTPRVEATLLPFLRVRFPAVSFGSLRDRGNPDLECVLVGEPQGMVSPVSQYIRLRVSVIARRPDGSGDFARAQTLAADIVHAIMQDCLATPIISADLSSGPMRLADGPLIFAYAILLLQVSTT